MRTQGGVLLTSIVVGLAFGYTLANVGFGDFAELHRMFTFQDLRMLFAFAGAVAIIAAVLVLVRARRNPPRIHAGVVPGAILFGIGWAISGGCPAIPLVQVGTGYLPALATIAGVVTGVRLSRWITTKHLHLDAGSCGT